MFLLYVARGTFVSIPLNEIMQLLFPHNSPFLSYAGIQPSSVTNGRGGAADPFTGGSAYTTTPNGGNQPIMHDFYPQREFLKFSTVCIFFIGGVVIFFISAIIYRFQK